jgi:thiol-disulfide isomerase/thioredoxin
MYKLIVLSILLTSCGIFKSSQKIQDKITISTDSSIFKFNNNWLDTPKLQFNYTEFSGLTTSSVFLQPNEESAVYSNKPLFFYAVNNLFSNYLLYPGEKYYLKMNDDGSFKFEVYGDQKRNNELIFFHSLQSSLKETSYYFFPNKDYKKLSIDSIYFLEDSIKNVIEIVERKQLKIYDSLTVKYEIRDSIKSLYRSTISINSVLPLITFYRYFSDSLLKYGVYKERARFVAQKFNILKNYETLFFNANTTLLNSSFALLISPSYYNTPQAHINNTNFSTFFELVIQNYSGVARDFLLSSIIYRAIIKNVIITKENKRKYLQFCKNKYLKDINHEVFLNKKKSIKKIKDANNLLNRNLKVIKSIESIIESYKGKVIVLDFWATWCLPCREETPYLKKLINQYNPEDVVFISISLDKEIQLWQKLIFAENFNLENNFVLVNSSESSFLHKLNINEIPRFILIGKDGSIVDDNAPKPSDIRLKEKIDSCLRIK